MSDLQSAEMLNNECTKCGLCCVHYDYIPLLKTEVVEGKFQTEKNPYSFESEEFSDTVLKRKRVYVPLLGRSKEICYYFDEIANLCTIHSTKPTVCRQHSCSRR